MIEELIALTREDAAALGCETELGRIRRIVAEGTSADRQLAIYSEGIEAGRSAAAHVLSLFDMDAKYADVVDLGEAPASLLKPRKDRF